VSDALVPIAYIVALIAIAAAFLWLVKRIANLIGERNTWLLFLCVIPLVASIAYSLQNWANLLWWKRLLYPFCGPVVAVALLLLAFVLVNPADALLLVGEGLRGAWRWTIKRIHGGRSDA
jgi:hypothetical protein